MVFYYHVHVILQVCPMKITLKSLQTWPASSIATQSADGRGKVVKAIHL